jgi:thioesterase domain-containing protein
MVRYKIGQFIQRQGGCTQFVGVVDVVEGSFEEAHAATVKRNRELCHLAWTPEGWFECPVGHSFFMFDEEGEFE